MELIYNYGNEFIVALDTKTEVVIDSIKYWSIQHRDNSEPYSRTTFYFTMMLGREIDRKDYIVMGGYAFFPMTDEMYMIPQIEMALAVLEVHKL